MDKAQIKSRFERVADMRAKFKSFARSSDDNWQSDYAKARRENDVAMADLANAIKFAVGPEADELGSLLNEFNRRLDRHQARWPVLIIKNRGPEYTESMDKVDEAFVALQRAVARL